MFYRAWGAFESNGRAAEISVTEFKKTARIFLILTQLAQFNN